MTDQYEEKLVEYWFGSDAAHDLSHIRRVWKNAMAIVSGDRLNVDQDVLRAAVVFHDLVNLPKDDPDRSLASQKSADATMPILREMGFDEAKLPDVAHAIVAHSFSAGIPPRSLEARVLRDADRLDALGAIGLARMLYVGAALGRPLYDPDDPMAARRPFDDQAWAIDHFETKLFGLVDGMLTRTGKKLAQERTSFLRNFRDKLLNEV
ncbi:MAG: HD domain-containing protein [Paracoccaceae bacterium]